MSNPFIPEIDVDLIRKGQVVFRGALMMADISGFTSMTEMLAESGKKGTEQLTSILNSYFDRMLTIISHYAGSVITFSGDSLLVRFTDTGKAVSCSKEMLESMNSFSNIFIGGNTFSLQAKVVVGEGEWSEYIIGDNRRSHVLLSGELVKELAQKESDALAGDLILFHSSAVASSIPLAALSSGNETFVSLGSQRLYGEHRTVTAVFLNVLTDNTGYKVMKNFQKLYFEISSTVSKFGGYLHHIDDMLSTGSRMLILFGAPVSHGNDTLNAVLALLEVFSDKQKSHGFMMSCGIDTGYTFSGMVGNEKRKQYTVIGDSVNTAARLAENTACGSINVSESVYNRTAVNIEYTELPGIAVKGKTKPLKRFTPLGRLTFIHDSIPFVGRKKELREIADLIHAGEETILVTGEAGIGKTSFLNKLQSNLTGDGFTLVRAEKTKHGPVNEILVTLVSGICGIEPGMDKEEVSRRLSSHLTSSGNKQLLAREVFLAKMLFNLEYSNRTFDTLPPKLKLENLLDSISLLLGELADPACVLIEDIHYSDKEEMNSLQEVIHSAMQNSEKQICFVLSTRPDDSSFLTDQSAVSHFHLHGLERQQSFKLLAGITDGVPMDDSISKTLTDRSQGNPFFLVQFLMYLKEKQLILVKNGSWQPADKDSLDSLPESIFSMIMARIDALAEQTRESLKVASVLGVKFDESILRRIVLRDVHSDMIETSRAGLTYSIQYYELEYIFSHMLIRDVAYDSLLRERRKQIHGDIGHILEEKHTAGPENLCRILAYHFENAENWESALTYSIEAGKLASEQYRNQEALEHYNSSIEIIEKHLSLCDQDLAECLYQSGIVMERTGEYPKAIERFRRSALLFSDPAKTWNVKMNLADILFTLGNMEEGLDLVDKLSNDLVQSAVINEPLRLRIASYKSWASCVTGDIDDAMEKALEAVEIGEALTGISEIEKAGKLGHALNTLATVHWAKSEYSKAKLLYERAIEIALSNDMKREAAVTYGNIGLVLEMLGELHEAVDSMKKQLVMSTEVGEKLIIMSAHGELGMTYAALGDFELALYHGVKQKELAESMNAMHDILLSYNHLALIHNTLGQKVSADKYVQKALKLSREYSFEREESHSLYLLGIMKKENALYSDAIEFLNQAEDIAERVHSYSLLQMICLHKADILIKMNNLDESRETLAKAWKITEMINIQTGFAAYFCTLGDFQDACGETEKAVESFNKGIAIYRSLDTKPALAAASRALALLLWKNGFSDQATEMMQTAKELYSGMKLHHKAQDCILQ